MKSYLVIVILSYRIWFYGEKMLWEALWCTRAQKLESGVLLVFGGMLTWGRGEGGGWVVHWGFSSPFINIETFESNNTQFTTWGDKKTNPTLLNKPMPILKTLIHLPFYPIRRSPEPNELYHKKWEEKKKIFWWWPVTSPTHWRGAINNNSSGYKYMVFARSPLHNIFFLKVRRL